MGGVSHMKNASRRPGRAARPRACGGARAVDAEIGRARAVRAEAGLEINRRALERREPLDTAAAPLADGGRRGLSAATVGGGLVASGGAAAGGRIRRGLRGLRGAKEAARRFLFRRVRRHQTRRLFSSSEMAVAGRPVAAPPAPPQGAVELAAARSFERTFARRRRRPTRREAPARRLAALHPRSEREQVGARLAAPSPPSRSPPQDNRGAEEVRHHQPVRRRAPPSSAAAAALQQARAEEAAVDAAFRARRARARRSSETRRRSRRAEGGVRGIGVDPRVFGHDPSGPAASDTRTEERAASRRRKRPGAPSGGLPPPRVGVARMASWARAARHRSAAPLAWRPVQRRRLHLGGRPARAPRRTARRIARRARPPRSGDPEVRRVRARLGLGGVGRGCSGGERVRQRAPAEEASAHARG